MGSCVIKMKLIILKKGTQSNFSLSLAKHPSCKLLLKSIMSPEYISLSVAVYKIQTIFLHRPLTLDERVLDAVLEGHYFLVILQICVRELVYFLSKLLLHFVRKTEHGLWLLRSNLQKVRKQV